MGDEYNVCLYKPMGWANYTQGGCVIDTPPCVLCVVIERVVALYFEFFARFDLL